MNAPGTAAGLGLISAASWGGSDFVGGLGSRRAPALLVVVSGHFVSLLFLLGLCLAGHLHVPARHDFLFAALGGFEGALALALFYRALAMAPMGLTAALTGLLTALVPVVFSLYRDGLPTLVTAAGLTIGLASLWLITHTPARVPAPPAAQASVPHPRALVLAQGWETTNLSARQRVCPPAGGSVPHPFRALCEKDGKARTQIGQAAPIPATGRKPGSSAIPLLLGALAGIGFGTQLILFKLVAGGGVLWAMTSARAAGVAAMLLVLLVLPPKAPWRGFWLFGVLAGLLDTAGNLLYIETTRFGRLDEAALVCSLYPAGTILLAALVLGERPTPRQLSGMALALAAVALLSL